MEAKGTARTSLWRRAVARVTKSAVELEADELHDAGARHGATAIVDLVPRQPAIVFGEVRSVALRPSVQVAALVVELYDGTKPMQLVWLGRRVIVGIEPGVRLRAQGRVTFRRALPMMFNPFYEIVPARG
jgi:hypothetical protein